MELLGFVKEKTWSHFGPEVSAGFGIGFSQGFVKEIT
jgi:hypothetical protein